jgi:hypothetical protein
MDFARVEAEFGRLKAQFERGALTEEAFKAQLEELMIEDEQGRWWILGYETGRWYVHDGEQWVQQEPPRAAPRPSAARPPYPQATKVMPDAQPRPAAAAPSRPTLGQRLGRNELSVLLIAAGWLVCFAPLGMIYRSGYTSWAYMAIAGGVSGLITGLVLRRTEPPSPWKLVPLVTLGWIIGWAIAEASPVAFAIIPAIAGLVGGGITALALKWVHPSLQWKHVALVTLGWGIGWVVGWAIGAIPPSYGSTLSNVLKYALYGGSGGAIGGWAMFRQLREALQPGGSQPSAAR